jgi:hypothetical protein
MPELGDKPISEEYRKQMVMLARYLDRIFNGKTVGPERKTGFVLMVFPYGEHMTSRCNYLSNGADRKDVVVLMKEMIARFEGQPELTGKG